MKSFILPDLLEKNLPLVFIGTAASARSAEEQAYYAHPGNRFYRTLFATGLVPTLIAPKDFPTLLNYGIGLTDIHKTQSGADSELRHDGGAAQKLREKIIAFQPETIGFTSKTAAAWFYEKKTGSLLSYGKQTDTISNAHVHILPSPSGRAVAYWDIKPWQKLAIAVRGESLYNQ
ncbi:MAG: mismatch-specific DNA-glycosylase [Parvibaculales bacterium]